MAFASFDDKRASAPLSEINMVPLIDVMLVLLVIFIVTAPLLSHSVKLALPKASAQVNSTRGEAIELSIDAQGQRYWNNEPLDRAACEARFAVEAAKPTPPELRLRADQAVPYREVARLLADAARAGLGQIHFVTEPEPEPQPDPRPGAAESPHNAKKSPPAP